MDILIKSAKIIYPGSAFNGKTRDILIVNGKIKNIAASIDGSEARDIRIYHEKNCCISIGWMDCKVNFREPGFEYKEDLTTGTKAAAAGGFTSVILMPSTQPPLQTKSDIEFLSSKTKNSIVDIYVAASLTINNKGVDLTEMYDLCQAGAVAFTDDKHPVENAGLLVRALQYCRGFGTPVITYAEDTALSENSLINEGETSIYTGIKGSPAIAEEVMIARNVRLCDYAKGRLHFSTISTSGSVAIIRQAKAKGIHVTAEVSAHHLLLEDVLLENFDSNYKVNPPLRSRSDINALRKGLADGTIDVICSDHSPHEPESKEVEFDFAAYGIAGLQTAFAAANTALHQQMSIEEIIEKFTTSPRKLFNIPVPEIAIGSDANLTLFNPEMEWTFSKEDMHSKSKNTPFDGYTFKGKALAVINNNKFFEV